MSPLTFLSKPPPPQKALPSIPLPPPPPSSSPAYSSIIAWATLVQPGSPAPRSPPSGRSSFSRRPSISISHAGYTSVFVHFPKSPTSPSPYLRQRSTTTVEISKPLSPKSTAHAHIPIPPMPSEELPVKRTGLSRLRSFSILRSRSKPKQQPTSPPSVAAKSKPTKSKKHLAPSTESCSSTIAKRKRAKYLIPPPPSLGNDLALMQFMDGGHIDSHAKRVMEDQAKTAAGSGAQLGVADVYRDGNGGIWWDADEEWEYTHLLADTTATPTPTSKANNAMAIDWEGTDPCYFTNPLANKENDPLERRESVSSLDSDLDPKYLVTVPEHTLTGFNAPVEDRVLASHKIGDPGMSSVLSLPSRPRRKALHLNKAEFLVDLAAFGPRSPTKSSVTPSTQPNPKGQARRRPAPLKLAHQSQNAVVVRRPGQVKTPATTTLENAMEKVRREFIADSFAPVPATTKTNTNIVRSAPAPPQGIMKQKPSRMNMRGLFVRKAN